MFVAVKVETIKALFVEKATCVELVVEGACKSPRTFASVNAGVPAIKTFPGVEPMTETKLIDYFTTIQAANAWIDMALL